MIWNKIGFGTWPLSGDNNGIRSYGKTNDNDSKLALQTAYDGGINFYDTSDFYGFGHVENLIGEILSNVRSSIVIATKGGMVSDDGKQNFSISHLNEALHNSLKRLKTDYVDVYMLHSPKLEILNNDEIFKLLEQFKLDGKIKEYGISLNSPSDGEYIIKNYNVNVIEVNYNILDHRSKINGLFTLCKERNIKVICRTPLAQGILTGTFKFSDDKTDKRQSWSPTKVEKDTQSYKLLLSQLNPNNYTDSQNCLRFCLSNSSISVCIPGMKTNKEVVENLESLSAPILTEIEIERLEQEYKKLNL